MVHLGGKAVHHHPPCLPVCDSYKPGFYSAAEAAQILAAIRTAVDERDQRAQMHRRNGTQPWVRGTVMPMSERGVA